MSGPGWDVSSVDPYLWRKEGEKSVRLLPMSRFSVDPVFEGTPGGSFRPRGSSLLFVPVTYPTPEEPDRGVVVPGGEWGGTPRTTNGPLNLSF